MKPAISWIAVLAMVLAACGTPVTGDGAAETPPASLSSDVDQSDGLDEPAGPEVGEETEGGGEATPTGTEQRPEDSSAEESIEQSVDAGEQSASDDAREDSADDRASKEPERVEEEPVSRPATGQVPAEMMAKVMEDLSARTGAAESAFTVVRAESVVWNDGSLGCAKPGETYTMALVDGYWIEIDHNGDIHDYRMNDKGFFKYCEGGGAAPHGGTDS